MFTLIPLMVLVFALAQGISLILIRAIPFTRRSLVFCDCIHLDGNSLDSCPEVYEKAAH